MEKLTLKKIVEFRGKSSKSKKTFVNNLKKKATSEKTGSGPDYWVRSLSSISNSFKLNDINPVIEKRDELIDLVQATDYKRTKDQYQRNLDILYNYEDFDLKKWRPDGELEFVKKPKKNSILTIRGLEVQTTPQHVFTFKKNGNEQIGVIWFIAKLDGFKKDELGMFADILYRYLKNNYLKNFLINTKIIFTTENTSIIIYLTTILNKSK